jgi:hypothetical protein
MHFRWGSLFLPRILSAWTKWFLAMAVIGVLFFVLLLAIGMVW